MKERNVSLRLWTDLRNDARTDTDRKARAVWSDVFVHVQSPLIRISSPNIGMVRSISDTVHEADSQSSSGDPGHRG